MTNDDNVKTLSGELHELAEDIAPSSSAARARARRGIARHTRNKRAALGAAAAVVVIATTAVVAVARDPRAAHRPAGTSPGLTGSAPPNVAATTAPTTAPPGRPTPGSPVLASVPPLGDMTALPSSYTKTFPWGTGPGQVALHTPQGEGASGGPVAFSADAQGDIVMLDHSTGRIVRLQNGADSSNPIGVSPAVTAAVFDSQGRVIVATVGDVAVYGSNGTLLHDFGQLSTAAIMRLQIVGRYVFSVSERGPRVALLADNGGAYSRVPGQPARRPDPNDVQFDVASRHAVTMSVSGSGTQYEIATADAIVGVPAVRVLPDGTLVFVLGIEQGTQSPDQSATYVVVRIDAEGHARYQTVSATSGYLVNGPGFVINDDGLAVMGGTTAGGVTVTYCPFN